MSKLTEVLEVFYGVKLDSEESVRQYKSTIADWIMFLGSEERVFDVSLFEAHRYIAEVKKRKGQKSRYNDDRSISLKTIKKKIDVLASFYGFLVGCKMCAENPFTTSQFKIRKKVADPKRRTEAVEFSLVTKMISLPGNTKSGLRDRAILMIAFGCGVRGGALQRLRISDFKTTQAGTLHIRLSKGKAKYYEVAVPKLFTVHIEAWLNARYIETQNYSSYLFTNYRGVKETPTNEIIPYSTLARSFKRYAIAAGAPDTISLHSGRATFISKMDSDGKTNSEIKECSGHSSSASVETYIWRFTGVDDQANINLNYG